ncbi:MAG TPA: hypothetical protein VFZ91_03480 [Allosphingosinicella sp.]
MSDYDRERETVRDTERTTVVQTDGRRGGGAGLVIAVLAIVALLAVLFFVFSGSFNRAADEIGVNVNVDTPKVEVPDVNIKVPDKIEVNMPDVDVKTDGQGNKAQ